jgi:SAM-dependent methyltransferase
MLDAHTSAATPPADWVRRFASLIRPAGEVLDVACGAGRHARLLAALGHAVDAVDRDASAIAGLAVVPGVRSLTADLEGGPWPYAGRSWDAIVVVNYLHRPLLPRLIGALRPGGVLIYETFMIGNERFGRPSNPDFLLRPGELLELVQGRLTVIAFEQGEVSQPKPAVVQRLCAVRSADANSISLPGWPGPDA